MQAEASADAWFAATAGDLVADAAAEADKPVEPATRSSQEATPKSRTRPIGPEKMIEEMITTARKRNEAVQNTPVAVTSFGVEQIANRDVRRISDVDGLSPNVAVDNAFGAAQAGRLTIRGVGQIETTTSFDPAVGIYVDGAYVPRSQGQISSIFDIERVEVLRGPQGTLYGKNTIGGAINVTTKKPEFELGASATARFGNYGRVDTRWMVNVPLVAERAAMRLAFASNYDEGYEKNTFRGDPSRGSPARRSERLSTDRLLGSRAELLLLPSANVEIMLSGEYTREDRKPQASRCIVTSGQANLGVSIVQGADLLGDGFDTCAAANARGDKKFASEIPSDDDFRVVHLANTINWEIGDSMMLKSITAFRNQHYDVQQDLDGTELGFAQSEPDRGIIGSNSISQELQLSGRLAGDRLFYTAGLFFFSEKIDDDTPGGASLLAAELQKRAALGMVDPTNPNSQTSFLGPLPLLEETRDVENRSYAAYGSVTYAITSQLSATVGLRRTLERRRLRKRDVVLVGGFDPTNPAAQVVPGQTLTAAGSEPFDSAARFDNWSPSASLSFAVTPRLLTYASFSTGFRSGGFNGRNNFLNPDINEIDDEDLTTYEVGVKSSFFDSRLLLNLAQFYSVYEDIQRPIFGPGPGTGLLAISFQNAAEARLHGTELELAALPFPGLRLESSVGTFRGRYTEFDDPSSPDIDDARLPGQPNYLMSFAVGYQVPVWMGLLSSRVQWTHRGVQANDARDTDAIRSPKYGLLDARLSLALGDGKTELTLFGSNLLDRTYIQNGIDATDTAGRGVVFFGPPRRYGVEVKRDF